MAQTAIASPNGGNVLRTCSSFVKTSKTSSMGASNSRVIRISRSLGNSISFAVTGLSLSLQLFEVLVDPPEPVAHRLLVLGEPVPKRPEACGVDAVEAATPVRPRRDEP